MPPRLLPRWYYIGALLLVSGLFASTLPQRVAHFDDAWLAEQAYWLRRDGYVHSELFRGFNGWERQLFVFHKGYVYVLAATLGVLGESLWAVKTTALLFVGLGLGLLLRYFRGRPEAQALAAVLYLGCGSVVTFGYTGRPEIMVMACGLASYLVLSGGSAGRAANLAPAAPAPPAAGRWALAGALAGLAALTHLNGLVFLAAGGLWLLLGGGSNSGSNGSAGSSRSGSAPGGGRWWRAAWFGLAGAATASLYLVDAALTGQLPVLVWQFRHDGVTQANFHLTDKLAVMREVPHMFAHSDAELPLTILFLLSLLLLLSQPRARPRLSPALRYLLLLLGAFWLLTKSSTAYYVLLFVPFFIIVSVETALAVTTAGPVLATRRPDWRRPVLLLVLALYPLSSALRARFLWRENATYPPTEAENARLAAHMPCRGAKVIAPLDFVFGQFDAYRIRGLTLYWLLDQHRPAGSLSLPKFFAQAAADSVAYVVADYRTFNQGYHIAADAPARIGPYQRVYQSRWFGLYARPGACAPAPARRVGPVPPVQ